MPVKPKQTTLTQFFDYCILHQLPFAFYRLPQAKQINVIAQKQQAIVGINNKQKGFVFAPFTTDKNFVPLHIQADIAATTNKLPALTFAKQAVTDIKATKYKLEETGKADFEKYVRKARKEIRNGSFKKIVVARVLKKKKPEAFNAADYFESLSNKYPHAFVSLVFTPQYGLWIGATPEILLYGKGNTYTTHSLAGTQGKIAAGKKVNWGDKELEEQRIVTDYITKKLSALSQSIEVSAPETIAAANLLHLRTTFTYNLPPPTNWQQVVTALHPTPAVAGLPKQKAVKFILKNEPFTRGFYSGYLGPVNPANGQANLFVNLRCMQVLKNRLAVYVGCGITAHSVPEKEWQETQLKAQTLLSVL